MHGKVGTLFVMLVLLSASISIIPFTFTAKAVVFGESVLVNGHETGAQESPRIVVDPMSNISVVWVDLHGGSVIYYGRSVDDGGTFLSKVKVDDAGVPSQRSSPAVAVNDTGSIFIVWSDERGGVSRIYFSKSDDNGSTFSANVNVSALGSIVQSEPDIAIANNTIYVVWAEDTNGTVQAYPNIFMSRSLDWGQTFRPPVRIDSTGSSPSVQAFPSIAARNNSVFIIWHDSRSDFVLDIYGSYSSDSGESFGQNIKVSDGKSETRQSMCDAAIMPDGSPCAVWHDGRSEDLDVRFAKSIDGGAHFLSSVLVSDGAPGTQQADPQMAIDSDGNVSVVYRDNTRGTYHVKYATSRNSGISFSSSVYADDAPTNVGTVDSVDVATNPNGTPMVVYDDDFTGSMDIYFTKMIDRPPMCQINFPIKGATIAGNVTIMGNASDPDGNETLVSVEVRIFSIVGLYDSDWKVSNGTVGWDFKVNTSTMINGPYEISARSYDGEAYSETARIQVTVFNEGQKWPDLAVAANDIIFSPKLPEKNKLVTISASVSNLGNLNVTNVAVRFQRENVLIGETQIGLVPSGENRTTSVQWVALLGDHLIKVIVDPDNIIVELNETDNEASRMITVVPSTFYQPDLEISAQNITLSSNEIKAGDSVVLTAEVFNFGNEGATNTAVTFVVDGNQVGKPNIDYVPINSSRAARVTWIATVGHHTINVTVDLDNQTVERNESNNRASISIDVKASGSSFPVWIIVVGVAIPLVLAVAIMYVMKWRRPKY
jgi:hypothetical protein